MSERGYCELKTKAYVISALLIFAVIIIGKILFYNTIGHFVKGLWGN